MRRVLAVALIAALTTMMMGMDATTWASQDRDHQKQQKQRAAVTRALGEMHRGSTATIERQDGEKMDVVIQEITPDAVTVMRERGNSVVTETIPIADIAKIKKASLKKMSTRPATKVLIATAVALGVLFIAAVAACSSAASSAARPSPAAAH